MSASHPEAVGGELLIIAVSPHYFVIHHSHGIVALLQLGGVFDFRIDPLTQLTLGLDEIVTCLVIHPELRTVAKVTT